MWTNIIIVLLIVIILYFYTKYKIIFDISVKNQVKINDYENKIKEKDKILEEAKPYLESYQVIKAENKERQTYIENVNKTLIENKCLVEKLLIYIIQKNYKGTPEDYTQRYNNRILSVENVDELLDYIEKSGQIKTKKTKKSPQIFLDEILDKVKNNGYNSLNDEEKKFLNDFDKK
jgi:glutaredoxin